MYRDIPSPKKRICGIVVVVFRGGSFQAGSVGFFVVVVPPRVIACFV